MNLQGRNLQQGLTGDDVRLLHTELALLNFCIPDTERLAAIQQFQKQRTLPITGIVEADYSASDQHGSGHAIPANVHRFRPRVQKKICRTRRIVNSKGQTKVSVSCD
jgi:hypothetical protein